ncbi:SGNH/GDSL hydrolase family protein [Gluconacetobacter azotocaptans]|uniref:SGNH/GDSL hydrolase family protein n=1 Tax=Gluconacetobacter azotocaptans TaxID=142834 RepID=A0A7W4JUV6_9PROT|nr:SGNH/GDSL hydrolase family protein [Gluconacetobacter azotocaptans]MBB2191346.1 SGNH/GDSL hydrolase family protein [Gluconacetobacter azotocaptans]MBM9402491.1 SGNH/GDSL hydrolase family protein [Gluconacetobacter azotocaptans]GBQ33593.1 lipolytic enzyme [Gluconacetobacter azotocaptans DSM 13594]
MTTDSLASPILPRLTERLRRGQPVRVTLFGSSTIEGIGASSPEHGFGPQFERGLAPFVTGGLTVINRGIGGNGAREMHDRLPEVLADGADLVLWQTGSNDPWQGVPVATYGALTRQDLLATRAAGADLALIDPQYCRMLEECAAFPPFVDEVHRIGGELGIPVFARYARMKSWCAELGLSREDLSPDGLHMGDMGYRLLGQAVAAWLVELTGAPAGAFVRT